MRTLRVTGRGELQLRPDLTKVSLALHGMEQEYEDALARVASETVALKEELGKIGFATGEVRTTDFQVSAEYISVHNKKTEEYERQFRGYRYSHDLKVEFPSDNARLGKILYSMAHSDLAPEIRFAYSVRDREAARNELLAKAVRDAQTKAEILAAAADERLGSLQSIDYSWGKIEWDVAPVRGMVYEAIESAEDSYDVGIEPDDIRLDDTVTVVWELA